MQEFPRIKSLPTYIFTLVNELKQTATNKGIELIDLGMGNPDQPPSRKVVDKLLAAIQAQGAHRYGVNHGINDLREALSQWYALNYQVEIEPEKETIVTIGSKEGIAHLAYAMTSPGDSVIIPEPSYPIHKHAFIMAGANVVPLELSHCHDYYQRLEDLVLNMAKKPKVIVLNFPANPTGHCVDLSFYQKVVSLCKQHNIYVLQDFAYADIYFDDCEKPPSILQVPGAKDVAVETYSLSKGHNMPGWRLGFISGNANLVAALKRVKSYIDYGNFIPIQEAAVTALVDDDEHVGDMVKLYQERRDVLCNGLNDAGWTITPPSATIFVWAKIPDFYQDLNSLAFTEHLIEHAHVAVSPGSGFGDSADNYVRLSLVANVEQIRQANSQIAAMFERDGAV